VTRVLAILMIGLAFGAFVDADPRAKPATPVIARVVGIVIIDDSVVVTAAAGSDQGIDKRWRARFRDGTTKALVAGGDAMIIRVDHRTTVLKTKLTADQVRANRFIQLEP
jgi:hypothetical protein